MLFPNVDFEKLKMELPSSNHEGSVGSSRKGPGEGEDLANLP